MGTENLPSQQFPQLSSPLPRSSCFFLYFVTRHRCIILKYLSTMGTPNLVWEMVLTGGTGLLKKVLTMGCSLSILTTADAYLQSIHF